MKNFLKSLIVRFTYSIAKDVHVKLKNSMSCNLLTDKVNQQVYKECVDYILSNARQATAIQGDKWQIRKYALSKINVKGSILEFGVWQGASFLWFNKRFEGSVFGFDSFEGLPETWTGTNMPVEKFKLGGKIPNTLKEYHQRGFIYAGLFEKTLPSFLSDRKNEKIALLHMDADLYSSTFYVLSTLKKKKKILKGTLILFDNYFGYPGWKFHEHKAIQELFKGRYEYVAYGGGDRCLIRITK